MAAHAELSVPECYNLQSYNVTVLLLYTRVGAIILYHIVSTSIYDYYELHRELTKCNVLIQARYYALHCQTY